MFLYKNMVSILLNLLTFASAYTVDEWKSRTIY